MKQRDFVFLSVFLFVIFTFTSTVHAQASSAMLPGLYSECDFCLCSQGISPLDMGGSALRFDTRYTELSQQYSSGLRVPNPANARETYLTNSLSLTEGIASGLCATIIVPFAHKTESSTDPANSLANISNSGIGDISLLARYNLIADHQFADTRIVAITAGVKLANGSTALLDNGAPADPDVQLGTGTTDFFAGLGAQLGFDSWSIGAHALAGIRGPGSGAAGHVYGNNLNYDLSGRYRIFQKEGLDPNAINPAIFAAFGVRGEWRDYELQDGQRIGDSGGNVLYATPGLQIFFTPRVSLDASAWLPVAHALNGDQLGETIKILAGLQMGL